jgi:hypothetical protein
MLPNRRSPFREEYFLALEVVIFWGLNQLWVPSAAEIECWFISVLRPALHAYSCQLRIDASTEIEGVNETAEVSSNHRLVGLIACLTFLKLKSTRKLFIDEQTSSLS